MPIYVLVSACTVAPACTLLPTCILVPTCTIASGDTLVSTYALVLTCTLMPTRACLHPCTYSHPFVPLQLLILKRKPSDLKNSKTKMCFRTFWASLIFYLNPLTPTHARTLMFISITTFCGDTLHYIQKKPQHSIRQITTNDTSVVSSLWLVFRLNGVNYC